MDYKELIEALDNCGEFNGELLDEAATAIETLLAEREAAIEDLGTAFTCLTCANSMEQTGSCEFVADCVGQYWQWRGPQKET